MALVYAPASAHTAPTSAGIAPTPAGVAPTEDKATSSVDAVVDGRLGTLANRPSPPHSPKMSSIIRVNTDKPPAAPVRPHLFAGRSPNSA